MSIQRKYGRPARIWRETVSKDSRGNPVKHHVETDPHEVRVWAIPQRSAKAEVPGQKQIDIMRIGVDYGVEDVGLWSRVELDGRMWDVVSPPALHWGTPRTRHWSIDLRARGDIRVDGALL